MGFPTKDIKVYCSKAQTYVNFSYKETATKTSNSQNECQFSAHLRKIKHLQAEDNHFEFLFPFQPSGKFQIMNQK